MFVRLHHELNAELTDTSSSKYPASSLRIASNPIIKQIWQCPDIKQIDSPINVQTHLFYTSRMRCIQLRARCAFLKKKKKQY
jgi:hypothetical protein